MKHAQNKWGTHETNGNERPRKTARRQKLNERTRWNQRGENKGIKGNTDGVSDKPTTLLSIK